MAEQPSQSSDEYELVPRSQLEYLQHEVEKLKKNPFGDSGSAKDMLSSVDAMNKNLQKLIAIFETANDEIVRDYKDKANTEKINMVLEQNEKLAKGIVAIADLLREFKDLKATWAPSSMPSMPAATPDAPAAASLSHAQLPPEWQSVMNAPQPQGAAPNPFMEPQGFGMPGLQGTPSGAAGAPFGAAPTNAPQAGRKLPPIDFSSVPPPPRR